jgi:serine/threonine protein kinase
MTSGDHLGHDEILDLNGTGGMGEVHLARDTRLDREVAIKVLPADIGADPERLARFRREARMLAADLSRSPLPVRLVLNWFAELDRP